MLASTELLLIRRPPECSWLPRRPGKFLKGEIFQNHRLLGCILWEISSTVERMQTITKAAQCENNSSLVMCFMIWSEVQNVSCQVLNFCGLAFTRSWWHSPVSLWWKQKAVRAVCGGWMYSGVILETSGGVDGLSRARRMFSELEKLSRLH